MVINRHPQRTPEWYACRLGIPTASNFDKIITSNGEPSKQRQKYLYQLAGEKLSGEIIEQKITDAMQKGIEREADARKQYELVSCETVLEVGFCLSDCGRYGSSPDGLVGETGGLEIKCPNSSTHIEYLLENKLPSEYFHQVQGNLLVTGREWWDFMSYFLNIKPFIIRVYRDEKFLMELEKSLIEFNEELQTIIKKVEV